MRYGTTRRIILLIAVVTLCIGLLDGIVNAHRSGCHRWHSCPSDSGSYTCGDTGYGIRDTGYDNYCGTQQTYAAPDYAQQGRTNGQSHATKDAAQIEQLARTSAETNGRQHGKVNQPSTPTANTALDCDKKFTFKTYQPSAYTQAYHDSYMTTCSASYTAAYSASYATAYETGLIEYQEAQKAAAVATKAAELEAAKAAEKARIAQIEADRVAKLRKAAVTDNIEWIVGIGVIGTIITRRLLGRRQRQRPHS